MGKITYKKSGVNIAAADKFVKAIKKTFGQGKVNKTSAFGSLYWLKPLLGECKDPILVSSTDGVGTKLLIAQKLKIHNTVGIDLVGMNVNDVVCLGAKPLFFLDYIACGKLKLNMAKSIIKGINQGLSESGCALLGGETAEMPGMYKADEYDLAGFCVGIVDRKKMIDGKKIKEKDLIIGIESSGPHSNGFSLIRKVFNNKELKKYSSLLLKPTRIYVKLMLDLVSKYNFKSPIIKGIAHITGGAFYDKATKILPSGLGMVIDKNSWKVPKIFRIIQSKARISEKEMHTVFNMGIGMILVVDRKKAKQVLAYLNKKTKAHLIGSVIKSNKRMQLV